MTAKITKRVLLIIGAVAGAAFVFLNFEQRDSYLCQVCLARKDVFQWRLGWWMDMSVPLTPKWERISDSHFGQDFFPSNHVHDWKFAQGSPYYFFGTRWGGCALGSGRHDSQLGQFYEMDPDFRAFVSTQIRNGSLAKSNFVTMVSTNSKEVPATLQKDADKLLEIYLSK